MPVAVSVVGSLFNSILSAGDVQFADEAAFVPGIGKETRNNGDMIWKGIIPVVIHVNSARVETTHEAGPAGGADRALAVGAGERYPLADEPVEVRGPDIAVAQSGDSVVALLVRADPQNVG